MRWIWFDMDGTIADLYAVNGWLDDLIAENTRPYRKAEMLYNADDLNDIIRALKRKGYNVGVISWSSKKATPEYTNRITSEKIAWLKRNNLNFDKVIVTSYGVRKADTCRSFGSGILVDDEEQNRSAWDIGTTIDATKDILDELKKLLDK
jgi:hypothetical protein